MKKNFDKTFLKFNTNERSERIADRFCGDFAEYFYKEYGVK